MKHTLKVTLTLLFLFLAAHIVGLYVTEQYLPETSQLPLNIQKPELDERTSFIPIFVAILIATGLALFLIRFQASRLLKFWFFLSVVFTLSISFTAFIPEYIAIALALILAFFKIIKPNIYVHNFTEIFIYGALSAIFAPVLNIISVSILLILISIYDIIAVWKTKHMVQMAKYQAKQAMFTGLLIPYKIPSQNQIEMAKSSKPFSKLIPSTKAKLTKVKVHVQEAILGGGDIGFPLLFSGVVLKTYGFFPAFLVSFVTAISLFVLFVIAEKKKFYPAMPFVSVGCFIGYLIVRLIF